MKKSVKPNLPTSSSTSLLLLFTALLLLLSQSSCANLQQPQLHNTPPPPSRWDLSMEEKTRLGSTPPSCYNKCNGCHPCMAVQVPSGPIAHRAQSLLLTPPDIAATKFLEPSTEERYSNYKPLGWKCRCRNHFYNP